MRRRLTYANVAATLALVFSMTGGALAANHYLINSTKQINPKVLKKLKGKLGATGATGRTGAAGTAGKEGTPGKDGAAGKEGKQGNPGPLLETLPSGKTERGSFGFASTRASGGGKYTPGAGTSYPIPLSFEPTPNVVQPGGASTPSCPGSATSPAAAPGSLCLYAQREDAPVQAFNEADGGRLGFLAFFEAAEGANYEDYGTWAVTAP
jgi:hypothetical protein